MYKRNYFFVPTVVVVVVVALPDVLPVVLSDVVVVVFVDGADPEVTLSRVIIVLFLYSSFLTIAGSLTRVVSDVLVDVAPGATVVVDCVVFVASVVCADAKPIAIKAATVKITFFIISDLSLNSI